MNKDTIEFLLSLIDAYRQSSSGKEPENKEVAARAWTALTFASSAFYEGAKAERAALIEQIKVAIHAQEFGLNDHARRMGLDKMLTESELMVRRHKLDLIDGQKDLVRWLEKGYFPGVAIPSSI